MPTRTKLWAMFGVVAIAGNMLMFNYFYGLPLTSQRVLASGFGAFAILVGLYVLNVFRRHGGQGAMLKAVAHIPGTCVFGGAIALSWAADQLWMALAFTVAAFLSMAVGTLFLLTGRMSIHLPK